LPVSDITLRISGWIRKRRFAKNLPILLEMLSPQKEDVILDVGAGTGVIANEISLRCDEVFALEPNSKRVKYMKRKYPQVKAFDGTAESIQFPESYFTKIYVISAFHHFRDQDTALFEFHRVLKPKGVIVINEWDPGSTSSKVENSVGKVHFLSDKELEKKLQNNEFIIKEYRKATRGYFLASTKI
jgi:ubiquinone/menaquinone biosynthesis C-methylase UbiE